MSRSVTIRSIDPIVGVIDEQESLFRFLPERYSSGLVVLIDFRQRATDRNSL